MRERRRDKEKMREKGRCRKGRAYPMREYMQDARQHQRQREKEDSALRMHEYFATVRARGHW